MMNEQIFSLEFWWVTAVKNVVCTVFLSTRVPGCNGLPGS